MRILFVSRAYPPVIGGIENQNRALAVWLPKHAETTTLANRRGKKFLPLFFPWALLRVLFSFGRYDVLLLGDGVLAPLGFMAKLCYPKKAVVSVVHGLDITYQSKLYQNLWVKFFLPQLDGYIAVSQATKDLALQHGLLTEKTFVIHNGFEITAPTGTRAELSSLLKQNLTEKTVLITVGRLVKRKGVAWFIEHVFPTLPVSMLYIVAGDGPEKNTLTQLIKRHHLESRVFLLGGIDEKTLLLLRNTADLFIQPNISIPGDIEGFGLSVIEAAASGLPVIASRLDGLQEAIRDGKNGFLVNPMDEGAFRDSILVNKAARTMLGSSFARYTKENYHWSVISSQYKDLLEDFVKSARDNH